MVSPPELRSQTPAGAARSPSAAHGALEQHGDGLRVAALRGVGQRRAALRVQGVHARARGQERLQLRA